MDATDNGVPVTQYYGCWVVDFYNDDRPHEALDQETPASLYSLSPRALPRTLAPMEYPGHFEVRLVSRNSGIRWKKQWIAPSIRATRCLTQAGCVARGRCLGNTVGAALVLA